MTPGLFSYASAAIKVRTMRAAAGDNGGRADQFLGVKTRLQRDLWDFCVESGATEGAMEGSEGLKEV